MKWFRLLNCGAAVCLIWGNTPAATAQDAERVSPTWTIPLYSEENPPPVPANPSPTNSTAGTAYRIGLFSQLIEVPSLRGKTWDEAELLLSQIHLVAVKLNELARKDDQVRNQDVAPGKKVAPGTPIKLDLVASVPNVVGLTLGEAYDVLEVENRFKMEYNPDWSSDLKITDQKPRAGEEHRRGRSVEVACMVRVPNLVGRSIEDAKAELTEVMLFADIRGYFEDTDQVLRQSEKNGKLVPALSKVRLTQGVEVPNLVGLGETQADRLLRDAKINGTPVYYSVATFNAAFHGQSVIEEQSIRAGNYITRDTDLRVKVRQYVYQPPVVQPVRPINPVGGGNGGNQGGGNDQGPGGG
jgi:beta-lactam-binding protein with PASTA domain